MGKNTPKFLVYGARNVLTGKLYIGSTRQTFSQRRVKHESRALNDFVARPLYRDIRRLGKDSFEWFEMSRCESEQDMRDLESELINLLGTAQHGYNVALDGGCNRGGRHSEKTKAKMSAAKKRWWRTHTVERGSGYRFTQIFRGVSHRAEVIELRASGRSFREISKVYGCAPGTVYYAMKRWASG